MSTKFVNYYSIFDSLIGTTMPDHVKTDADKIGEKLDKLGAHLDSLHTRMDGWDEERKADRARLDAICAGEKERADAEEAKKKEEEKTAADAAARADAAGTMGSRTLTQENRAKFAAAQMRLDRAFQAWGTQAPHPLHGEDLRLYRNRLLGELKRHSKTYKDSALNLVGDDASFDVIEDTIINDAVHASNTTFTEGKMRKVTSKMDSGHVVTKWVGDPLIAWAPFSGGATKFGRINADMANRGRT